MPRSFSQVTNFIVSVVGAPMTEVSQKFFQRMADSMANSFFKYGPVADGYPKNVNAIDSLVVRLVKYAGIDAVRDALHRSADQLRRTESAQTLLHGDGNMRWLVDTANFAMIETMHPRHERAHWPEDDVQSPGRVSTGGVLSERANTTSQEAVRNPEAAPSWMRRNGD